MQSWVAITVALTGALSNYLDFKRVEATLVGYNRAADGLYDVEAWWNSLSLDQKQNSKNCERLVISTEAIIRSEHVSWLQDMQDRLAEMYGNTENETYPENNNEDQQNKSG
ncbi:SLATT domain-containing protein [Leptothoe sp. EHU-05/26/07-4]